MHNSVVGCRNNYDHSVTSMTYFHTFLTLWLLAVNTSAASLFKERLESFANSLTFSVTSNQAYIYIPASYFPWNGVSVFQYQNTESLSWASNSTSCFLDCKESKCIENKNVSDMGLTNQIGVQYTGQPTTDCDYVTYISPKFLGSTNNENNVTFVVSIDYNKKASLVALIDVNFI